MAYSFAPSARCMYLSVVERSACPASSWITFAGAPRMAKGEQNVWRSGCHVYSSIPARAHKRGNALRICEVFFGLPSALQITKGPRRCRHARNASCSRETSGMVRKFHPFVGKGLSIDSDHAATAWLCPDGTAEIHISQPGDITSSYLIALHELGHVLGLVHDARVPVDFCPYSSR